VLGDLFASGRSKFLDHLPDDPEPTAKIYIKVRLAGLPGDQVAQLDTGAAWSVLSPDLARAAGLENRSGERVGLASRFGIHQGRLLRLPVTFIAEEGESLETDGTFFVSRDWPSSVSFLGYSGLLANIRFALDPQSNDFYFGA
jgi:hypothetical protein